MGADAPCLTRFTLPGDQSLLPGDTELKPQFIKMARTAGNKCRAVTWKTEDPPFFSLWLKEMASYGPLKKQSLILKETHVFMRKCWGDIRKYFENMT